MVSIRKTGKTTEPKEHTIDIETRALVEETQALGAVLAAEQVLEGASQGAGRDFGGVARVADLVAASDLVAFTTDSLGLFHGHVLLHRPERLLVRLVSRLHTGTDVWQGSRRSGDSKQDTGELHF